MSIFLCTVVHADVTPAQTGCHAGGGNIVQAGASLQTDDLEKNGAATTDAIYKLIYSGKGKMPGYGKDCTPRVCRILLYHSRISQP